MKLFGDLSSAAATPRILSALTIVLLLVIPLPHATGLRTTALVLLTILALAVGGGKMLAATPLKGLFAVIAAWGSISLSTAMDVGYSLGQLRGELLLQFCMFFAFYATARHIGDYARWLTALINSLALASAVMASCIIVKWQLGLETSQPYFFYNGVGSYTTFASVSLPLLLFHIMDERLKAARRLLLAAALALSCFAIYLTLNRLFWVVAGLSFVCLLVLLYQRRHAGGKLVAFALLATILLSPVLFYQTLTQRLKDIAPPTQDVLSMTATSDLRPRLWQQALQAIASRPLTGHGYGLRSFQKAYPEFSQQYSELWHAHNLFIDAGIQLGIPGALLLIALFIHMAWLYLRRYRDHSDPAGQALAAVGLTLILACVARNMTDDFFHSEGALIFWALNGALMGGIAGRLRTNHVT